MIADASCNVVYYSDLLPRRCPVAYRAVADILDRYGVPHAALTGTKDIWVRDFMPIQAFRDRYLSYSYTPDYLRDDERYRQTMSDPVAVCRENNVAIDRHLQSVRLDGGNVVRGATKFIMTAKVFEENPAIPVRELCRMLEEGFGAEMVVLPWDTKEIYGHADGIVRIVDADTAIMGNYRQIDARMGQRFLSILKARFRTVHELHFDVERLSRYSWAYINWLLTDRVIVVPSFGVPEDEQALRQIERWMPEYRGRIEMADARDLVRGGGGFNCATWTVYESFADCRFDDGTRL